MYVIMTMGFRNRSTSGKFNFGRSPIFDLIAKIMSTVILIIASYWIYPLRWLIPLSIILLVLSLYFDRD